MKQSEENDPYHVFISHSDRDHFEAALSERRKMLRTEIQSLLTKQELLALWDLEIDLAQVERDSKLTESAPISVSGPTQAELERRYAVLIASFASDIAPVKPAARPPFNAEYLLFMLINREEREAVIGDLTECYCQMIDRFGKRRANLWFYKQVVGSMWPFFRQALFRIGALVWLGRILRRLIS